MAGYLWCSWLFLALNLIWLVSLSLSLLLIGVVVVCAGAAWCKASFAFLLALENYFCILVTVHVCVPAMRCTCGYSNAGFAFVEAVP